MSDCAIEIKNLVKKFDDFTLGPIDFSIPKGTSSDTLVKTVQVKVQP